MTRFRSESAEVTVVPADMPFEVMRGTFSHQRFLPHAHKTYAIGTMERGISRVKFRGRDVIRSAGDVVTIAPGEVHTGETVNIDGWAYRMLYIPSELMSRFTGCNAAPAFAECGVHDPELAERIASAHTVMESAASVRTKSAALEAVMSVLCERCALRDAPPRDNPKERMTEVRLYIEANCTRQVSLAQLAEIANVGSFHLINEFRRAFGIAPYAYLMLVRVMRAQEMLSEGRRPSEVAFSMGFSDQSHLTRQFKHILGVTPARYARSHARSRTAVKKERAALR